jgi:hypothetical protein
MHDSLPLRQVELHGVRGRRGPMLAGHELQQIGLQRGRLRDRQDVRLQLQLAGWRLPRPGVQREWQMQLLMRQRIRLHERGVRSVGDLSAFLRYRQHV